MFVRNASLETHSAFQNFEAPSFSCIREGEIFSLNLNTLSNILPLLT